jgi:hypothetical protein
MTVWACLWELNHKQNRPAPIRRELSRQPKYFQIVCFMALVIRVPVGHDHPPSNSILHPFLKQLMNHEKAELMPHDCGKGVLLTHAAVDRRRYLSASFLPSPSYFMLISIQMREDSPTDIAVVSFPNQDQQDNSTQQKWLHCLREASTVETFFPQVVLSSSQSTLLHYAISRSRENSHASAPFVNAFIALINHANPRDIGRNRQPVPRAQNTNTSAVSDGSDQRSASTTSFAYEWTDRCRCRIARRAGRTSDTSVEQRSRRRAPFESASICDTSWTYISFDGAIHSIISRVIPSKTEISERQ